jgi:RND family efflux transporter MFP subunit
LHETSCLQDSFPPQQVFHNCEAYRMPQFMSRSRTILNLLGALAFLAAGGLVFLFFVWTAPKTRTEEETRRVRIVQTMTVTPRTERIAVTAFGPVVPAQRVIMKPEVRGRVVQQHPALVPGGYLQAGEPLVHIDPADYRLALTEKEAELEQAEFELAVEKGRQVVASHEWRLLQETLDANEVNQALVLREPHLKRIEALLRKATNEIAKAQLALTRTTVEVPFNAMVLEESVEVGQLVESGAAICTLVGTDEFWVQAALPLDKLQWIRVPRPGVAGPEAAVVLDTGNGSPARWRGEVVRLLSDLETTGRMARVLIRVPDPLGLRRTETKVPLLIGSYVQVEIVAGELENVLAIPRAALREGDRIWIVDANNELQIRDADIRWTRGETLLIANTLQDGEQLVVSGLRTALPGMKVNPQPVATEPAPAAPPLAGGGP